MNDTVCSGERSGCMGAGYGQLICEVVSPFCYLDVLVVSVVGANIRWFDFGVNQESGLQERLS